MQAKNLFDEVAQPQSKVMTFTLATMARVLVQPIHTMIPRECQEEMQRFCISFKFFKEMQPPDSVCLLCSTWLQRDEITPEDLNQILYGMTEPEVVSQVNFYSQLISILGQRTVVAKQRRARFREKQKELAYEDEAKKNPPTEKEKDDFRRTLARFGALPS